MPRYFFHVIDGTSIPDAEGTELASIYVAQAEAVSLCGELLRDLGGRFWDGAPWRLEVTDEQNQVLFVLHFSAEERLGAQTGKAAGSTPGAEPSSPTES